jgi:hypothetical protein
VSVDPDDDIEAPPEAGGFSKWEQQSVALRVSEGYEQRMEAFNEHFESEMEALGDENLAQESEILERLERE